jgi:hypothetical protein
MEEHIELFDAKENWGKWLDQWQANGLVVPSGSKLGQHLETLVPVSLVPASQVSKESKPQTSSALTSTVEPRAFPGSQRRWKCVYRDPGTMVWVEENANMPSVVKTDLPSDRTYGQ